MSLASPRRWAAIIVSATGQKNAGQENSKRRYSDLYFSVGASEWPKR
jgi:hypothetical protein